MFFAAAVCSARLVCGGGGPSWRTVWGVLCCAVLVGVLRCSSLFLCIPCLSRSWRMAGLGMRFEAAGFVYHLGGGDVAVLMMSSG